MRGSEGHVDSGDGASTFRPLFDKESLDKLAHGDDPLDFENLFRIQRGRESARLHDAHGPMIIIAGSGMVTGGRILAWMRAIPDVRRVALHHGDVEAQEAFATWAPEQLAPV